MSLFRRPSLLTIHAALVAMMAVSACSSSKSNDSSLSSFDDSSMPDFDSEFSQESFQRSNGMSKNRQRSAGSPYRLSVRPAVHSMPVKAGNHWMNAFYFVTSENETWRSLAIKFYNKAEHTELVRSWNMGQVLKPGSVVYYNSPFRPQDQSNMLSFTEDFGQRFERRQVQAGDSLSKIAGRLWGNVHAWPAIAAVNPQITHPDVIEVGEVLFIPASFDTSAALAKVVNFSPTETSGNEALESNELQDDDVNAVTGTLNQSDSSNSDEKRTPLRTSTLIVLAGLIMILSSLVYFLWRRAQNQDSHTGSLSKMDKLTSFFKTKSGY
jgi:LysM repeat protein